MAKMNAVKIVAAGEDFAAVLHAQALSKRLADGLKPKVTVNSAAWKFAALDDVQVGRMAAKKAAKADMVIIAASAAAELPAHVKNWIEAFLSRKRKAATALVALLQPENRGRHEPSPFHTYLQQLAEKWRVDFFSNAVYWQGLPYKSTAEIPCQQHENRRFDMPGDISPK
jgi:hypothetical protein